MNETKKKKINITIAVFIAATLFIISNIFFKIIINSDLVNSELVDNRIYPYTFIFTILFGFIIYGLALGLGKTSFRATIICYSFIFVISILNEIKVSFSGEPLYFSDINFLSNTPELIQLVTENLSLDVVLSFLISISLFAIVLISIILLNRKFNFELKSDKSRIALVIINCLLLVFLFFPNSSMKDLYLRVFFNTDNHVGFDTYTTNLSFYSKNGFINGMYGVALNSRFTKPFNYNDKNLNDILEKTSDIQVSKKIGKPNIILFFSESFWDVDQLDEIEFNIPVSSNFNELKNEGIFVNMVTPTYGGLSENVAFELLTSANMSYFPNGYIPVMSLYSRNNTNKIPSLVKELKNNGYSSDIIFGKDYYNSEKAYLSMGFDNYVELVEDGQLNVSDEYMTSYLIEQLEKDKNSSNLYVVETIASHMPYTDDKYDSFNVEVTKSKLNESMNTVLKSYAQGIYNADIQLKRLYDYIQDYEDPTIIIFLGDHLPFLDTPEQENVIDSLEYFNTEDTLLNNYRLYNTQALLLSNFDIKGIDIPEYLGTDLLIDSLINHLDLDFTENGNYYKWLYSTKDLLPASNKIVSLDKDGKLYSTNDLQGEMKELYDTKDLMQYKFFIK